MSSEETVFTKGDDCPPENPGDNWLAGIDVNEPGYRHGNRIEVWGKTEEHATGLRDRILRSLSANGGEAVPLAGIVQVASTCFKQVLPWDEAKRQHASILSASDSLGSPGAGAELIPLYPAPPSVAVPDDVTAAPSPDHSGDANKMVTPEQFKAFHAALCRRFGYTHDEQYWWRDLVSLEEHIAAKVADHIADAGKVDEDRRCSHGVRHPHPCRECEDAPLSIAEAGKVAPVSIPDSEFDETNPVHQAADAYSYACEIMEQHQAKRVNAGKDPGTIGSLCDGLAWLYGKIEELEDTPSVPENEVKARAVEQAFAQLASEYAPYGLRNTYTAFDVSQHIEAQGKVYAARLRTAGDDGEEETHG